MNFYEKQLLSNVIKHAQRKAGYVDIAYDVIDCLASHESITAVQEARLCDFIVSIVDNRENPNLIRSNIKACHEPIDGITIDILRFYVEEAKKGVNVHQYGIDRLLTAGLVNVTQYHALHGVLDSLYWRNNND